MAMYQHPVSAGILWINKMAKPRVYAAHRQKVKMSQNNVGLASSSITGSAFWLAHLGKGIAGFVNDSLDNQGLNNKECDAMDDLITNLSTYDFDNENPDNYDGTVTVYSTDSEDEEWMDCMSQLPDWKHMDEEDVMRKICYHKRINKNGVLILAPMKDENGNLIPIRRDWDCSTFGRNKWGADDPETALLNAIGRDFGYLEVWNKIGLVEEIDGLVKNYQSAVCVENAHPFQDAEDIVEALILRHQEGLEKLAMKVKRLIANHFGKEWKKIWSMLKARLDVAVVDALAFTVDETSETLKVVDADELFKIRCEIAKRAIWLKEKIVDAAGNEKWITFHNSAKNLLLDEFKNKYGKWACFSDDINNNIQKWASGYFWMGLSGWRTMKIEDLKVWVKKDGQKVKEYTIQPAVLGTLERYVRYQLQIACNEAWGEDNHVDRLVQKMDLGTDHAECWRRDVGEWEWNNRSQSWEE